MVKKWLKLSLLLLAAGLALLLWRGCFNPSDEALIRQQLRQFKTNASKYPGEGMAQGVLKCKALENLFDQTCQVNINIDMFGGNFSPEEIAAKAMFCRNNCNSAVIDFHHIKITVDGKQAEAVLTASLDGAARDGRRSNEYRELSLRLKKIERKWLIYSINIHQILEK